MIQNLNQETIRSFGTVLPASDASHQIEAQHRVQLHSGSTREYETLSPTVLDAHSSMIVLSVLGEQALDFYLDKPVQLQSGVRFALAALDDSGAVSMMAAQMPKLLQAYPTSDRLLVKPRLRLESVCTLFYQERERGFLFAGESHPMLELTYVDQGSLHSVVDGQDVVLEQGDMMLYGPNQWHMQYADMEVAPRFVTISFTTNDAELQNLYNRKFRSPQKAISYLQQILREQERGGPDAGDSILSLLTLLIISLRREGATVSKPQLSNSVNNENEIIRAAQQYISANVCSKLSVPMVAKGVDVSPSYLTALFHKHLQIAPGEYIRRIKLQRSKQMIREGNLNFTEIAATLQYSTVHHFSRQFKEKFGLTPTEYARSVR